jgi:hypothetical protein
MLRQLAVMAWAAVLAGISALPSASAWAVDPLEYSPVCSLSRPGPCTPAACTLSDGPRCVPYVMPQLAQDFRVTIRSRSREMGKAPERPVDSLRDLYNALRRCWQPPAREDAHFGMQMSVRLAFKRSGEIISPPRVTYVSNDIDAETRNVYRDAITASLERCTPLPLSEGFGGAIAGRPIAIRFVDDRTD